RRFWGSVCCRRAASTSAPAWSTRATWGAEPSSFFFPASARAQGPPVERFGHDALEGGKLDVARAFLRPDRAPGFLKLLRRRDHHAAKLRHREIARAEVVLRAVGDRPHRLPHRHVLRRDAGDARPVAALHRLAVLQVAVREIPFLSVVAIQIDTDFGGTEAPPGVLADALRRVGMPGDPVEH